MLSGFLIGAILGLLLQRGQFCFVSGFRNLFLQKNLRFLTALLLAVSIQSIGLFSLEALGWLTIPSSPLPLLATVLGGLAFGVGMMLANCCGSGAWLRSGEGLVGSWLALLAFSLTLASAQSGRLKSWLSPLLDNPIEIDNIHTTLGIAPWWLVALLWLMTFSLFLYLRKNPRFQPLAEPTQAVVFPQLFSYRWNLYLTATLIGLLGILAWLASAKTGRNFGFGIAVPSANVVQYWVTGQARYLNWGSLFVLGILLGSYLSAKLSGEFAITMPRSNVVWQRVVGGALMGVGASLAGGCTITNSLVATAYFSWQGWLATLMIILGCWLTTFWLKPTACRI